MRLLYRLAGAGLAVGLVLLPSLAQTYAGGAPPNWNGAPGSNGTCVACHSGADVNSGTGAVTLAAPATFAPGDTLELVVAVDNTTEPNPERRQGFLISVHDAASGEHAGQLVVLDPMTTQPAQGDENFLTQTPVGSTVAEWAMQWVAPEDAPDSVTVYVAANAANGNGSPSGDFIYTTTAALAKSSTANEPAAQPLAARIEAVYPNPVRTSATVAYALDRPGAVTLTLFDGRGRTVRTTALGVQAAGAHTVSLRADGLAAGIYFLEVSTPQATDVRPVTVVR